MQLDNLEIVKLGWMLLYMGLLRLIFPKFQRIAGEDSRILKVISSSLAWKSKAFQAKRKDSFIFEMLLAYQYK